MAGGGEIKVTLDIESIVKVDCFTTDCIFQVKGPVCQCNLKNIKIDNGECENYTPCEKPE
jgi:hypothetical protein|tara:strand:+ start:2431 stop:2610 length:180 start_codon:yes stop_codon:yes gene_type:complete